MCPMTRGICREDGREGGKEEECQKSSFIHTCIYFHRWVDQDVPLDEPRKLHLLVRSRPPSLPPSLLPFPRSFHYHPASFPPSLLPPPPSLLRIVCHFLVQSARERKLSISHLPVTHPPSLPPFLPPSLPQGTKDQVEAALRMVNNLLRTAPILQQQHHQQKQQQLHQVRACRGQGREGGREGGRGERKECLLF